MAKPIFMVKIGGSMITDPSRASTARPDQIIRLLREIKSAKSKVDFDIILGHGGGSFGHIAAKEYRINEGLVHEQARKGFAITHLAMRELNRIVVEAASDIGLDPCPFAPLSFAYASGGRLVSGNLSGIGEALRRGFMPIVHGDGIFDSQKGVAIASTEEVFRFLSLSIKPGKVIIGTDTDGVFDKDPNTSSDARLIRLINRDNIDAIMATVGGARKIDVTGGMKSKLGILYEIAKGTGTNGYIANAAKPDVIENLLLSGEVSCTEVRF